MTMSAVPVSFGSVGSTMGFPIEEPARPWSVCVIGGFLGSGKTTLLKRLIAHEITRGVRPAVLMNEYGERNVDSRLLHDHAGEDDVEMRELLNGCICCDLSEELSVTVGKLLRNPSRPIFVETTGLADVGQVVAAVGAASGVGAIHVIVVLDARRCGSGNPAGATLKTDVRAADLVLVNKVEGVRPGALRALLARVRTANPRARILTSSFADVDPQHVLEAPRARRPRAGKRGTERRPVDSSRGFASVTCSVRGRVRLPRLRALLAGYGDRIARLKGFVRVVGRRGMQEVQWVPGSLEVRPFSGSGRRRRADEHLIIIGRDVDWDRFFEATTRCVATTPTVGN